MAMIRFFSTVFVVVFVVACGSDANTENDSVIGSGGISGNVAGTYAGNLAQDDGTGGTVGTALTGGSPAAGEEGARTGAEAGAGGEVDAGTSGEADAGATGTETENDGGVLQGDASTNVDGGLEGPDGGIADPDGGASSVPPAGTIPVAPPTPSGCITDASASDNHVFDNCGQNIVFNVSVPSQCLEKACGLIFDVHGFSMNGLVQEENTNLARLGREKSYIVVQPSAPNASWNGAAHYPVVIDFMNLAIKVWNVEKRRVHFTGFSQGGRMTWTMRCTQSEIIASAAPIAMTSVDCEPGLPVREMPVLYTQGQSDEFAGDGRPVANAYISAHLMREDQVLSSDAQHTWTRYVNDDGLLFEFIDHTYSTSPIFGAGHCFPGSFSDSSPYGCDQSAPFHFGEVVMEFFIAHPMD
ncbi:MAG: hypothetical protein JXA30_13180 [Deltaproteobacteria bacterium]|nr:hypothetical protein [Deltaproteobacteria bacterium]